MRLEIVTTQACNAVCEHCNRGVGLMKVRDSNLTGEQMERAAEVINEAVPGPKRRVTLGGGEPMVNPHLQSIIDAAAKIKRLKMLRVLTNDVRSEKRKEFNLPRNAHWVIAPLDRAEGKSSHVPFFVSPKDYGIEANYEMCDVRGWCGRGFDAFGFMMCGVAGILGRLLGINPYRPDYVDIEDRPEVRSICEHCPYGAKGVHSDERIFAPAVARGEMEAISPTFKEGFERFKDEPMQCEKW